ncbi:hypothetical protein A2U01_0111568, partial [Trifolium medium]|nr:hypothetical protein [Trifolium medium]
MTPGDQLSNVIMNLALEGAFSLQQ